MKLKLKKKSNLKLMLPHESFFLLLMQKTLLPRFTILFKFSVVHKRNELKRQQL